ncbi:MAG: RES family NAD+ phosphorylase [Pseudomonadota bacterium]
MKSPTYPRSRIDAVVADVELAPSIRIMPKRHAGTPLGTAPGASRFCSRDCGFTLLYAAPHFSTALIEVVLRDRFTRKTGREIHLKEITERSWAGITSLPGATLRVLDLREDGCVRLGAPTDAIRARNHAAGRALGRAIHAEHRDVDGFLFSSRLTGADVYAIFDRAVGKLRVEEMGNLADHPDLPAVFTRFEIGLIVLR